MASHWTVNASRRTSCSSYTAKTGTPVYCPLPDSVVRALESSARTSPRYFFWTGISKPKSAVGDWQRSLQKLFRLAQVPNGHAHRFRDTFAVELLLAGVPLERVSMLLGHQSVKITEKHYAPWVHARQAQLEADVERAWQQDPILSPRVKGAYKVHGSNARTQVYAIPTDCKNGGGGSRTPVRKAPPLEAYMLSPFASCLRRRP